MNHPTFEPNRSSQPDVPAGLAPATPAAPTPGGGAGGGSSVPFQRRLACAVRVNPTTGDVTIRAGSACAKAFCCVLTLLLIGTVAFVRTVTRPGGTSGPVASAEELIPINQGDRITGLNYLVLKSCPTQAEANAVRGAMLAKGVPCTVEPALADWTSKGWYSVVGTAGFHVTTAPEYRQHVAALQSLKIDPKPYKWRPQEVMTASAQ